MPEQLYERIKKCKKEWMICFMAAVGLGFAAHMYKLANFIPNWDSLVNFHNNQDTTYLGRCFLQMACSVGSWYDLPWVNGLLSLIYIGLSAVCICELFELRTKTTLVLTGGMMAAFPTVTSTLAYNYTADGYMAALFCSCLAILLLVKIKGVRGFVLAAFLLMFSLGIYQAYITFAMMFVLVYLLDCLLLRKITMKQIWSDTLRFLGAGIVGSALYWLALKLSLVVSRTELSSYQGIAQAFSLTNINILHSAKQCVIDFAAFFFDFSQGLRMFPVLNVLLFVLLGIFIIAAIKTGRIYKEPVRLGMAFLCVVAMPFVSYALYFLSYLEYHNLMVMCHAMIYVFFIIFYERMPGIRVSFLRIKQWAVLLISSMIIYNFILIANISYQKMQMIYEKSYATALRMVDRIEQLPEAELCEKLAVIGSMEGSGNVSVTLPPDMTGVSDTGIIWGQEQIQAMIQDYFGLTYEAADEQEISDIEETEIFKEMSCWPDRGSVAVYEGTLIIRLSEE